MTETVTTRDADGLRTIAFEAGERNLLNPQIMGRLRAAILDADDDTDVAAILLASTGPLFCGGLDIPAIRAGADPVEFAGALVELLHVFPRLTKPIAAAVHGDALAGGAALVASVDYAVAVPTAMIGSHEVSAGIWPMVAQVPLAHRIGVRPALENIGSGEPFTAHRAKEVGLVQSVVEPDQLTVAVTAWLTGAMRGGAAYALGRPSFYEFAGMDYDAALDAAFDRFSSMFKESS